ncbi:mediator of RNA polymerase II transcription subunit 6 [Selaginella moellendorffii]|nr:mediator of RNA polymerase II transcription subunit 6 [Selaginella moellendorffii]|eukprot:XP_002974208.2 mediator of RNA polymerase II transcription subunit 6 [Selaginella moellendorffii]
MAEGLGGAAPPLPTDQTGISFHDQLWLSTYPLDRNLVFDYFVLSPFYDRSCSNEQLRMRSVHPLDMTQLSKMTGVEYVLLEAQEPNLFVLRKQKRESPDKVLHLSAYYILDSHIYQAPLLYSVVCSRVARAVHHISAAFSQVSAKLEKIGYDDENEHESDTSGRVDLKEILRIDQILGNVLRKLPPAPPPPPMPTPPSGVPEQPQDSQPEQSTEQGPPAKKAKVEKR